MPRFLSALRSTSLLLCFAVTSLAAQGGTRRVIVTLRSTSSDAALRAPGAPPVTGTELAQIASRLDRQLPSMRETGRAPFAGMLFAEVSAAEATQLAADPNVAAVEEDRLWGLADSPTAAAASADRWRAFRAPSRADDIPWGVSQVTAPAVWATGNRGQGVKVAVLDSGGDQDHPDLNWAGGYNPVTLSTTDWDDNVAVCNGHGTHIAGTIAAKDDGNGLVGVAPGVQLYAIKVFTDQSGQCLAYTSAQIAGINWAVSQGIRLVNVSIGGSTSSTAYNNAVTAAANSGTYVIAASGNTGGAVLFPAAYSNAIAVAALDASNLRASWSSFGPEVDFAAPGVGINSTMPGGGYGGKSGTSMATPHVVGVAALLLSAQPGLTFDGLKQKLRDGALDVDAGGFDANTGYGLVRAQNSLGGGSPPPPVPLSMAVSPLFRSTTATAGSAAAGSNASITLSGDNSTTTAWTATKRKSWTTLTTGSGTGSGTVAWNRSTTGLAVGTYVDTITVAATGVASQSIIDTLRITAAPVPLSMAVSPLFRSTTVTAGSAAPGSNASITLSGDNSTTTAWTATKRKSWTTLTTGSGTGSGTVAWNRSTTGLAAGTYVDTITVAATGVASQNIIDTLRITAAPVPLAMTVSPSSRSASAQAGTAAPSDNASITLTGDNAGTTAWTAAKRKSWTTLTTAGGTGSGTAAWSRSTAGLAAGTYVDTITVTVVGLAPQNVIDTLRVTAAPVPLTLAVNPGSRSTSAQVGTVAAGDNASISLAGDNAGTTAWTAAKRKSWTTLTTGSGTGSGTATWSRSTAGLAAGTYVDTITVTVLGLAPQNVIDTLRITAAPVPLALAVSPASRSAAAQTGTAAPGDNATVSLTGDNAGTTAWTAAKRKSWTTLTTASGTGSGTAAWTRSTAGLAAGTYVDTITVTVVGLAPQSVIDTLRITAAPVPLALAVSPTSRSTSATVGGAAAHDNATVSLTGDNAAATNWSASKRKSWTTLTTGNGTGSGTLAWSRSTAGLAVGTYVDTLMVTVTGLTPQSIIDTLRVTAAPVAVTVAVSPGSRSTSVVAGSNAASSSATVTLSGDNAASTAWTATKRKSWTSLTTASGVGNGTVAWSHSTAALAAGTYVDTITVTAGSSTARVIDTVVVTPATSIALVPKGKKSRLLTQAGQATALAETKDSAIVSGSVRPGESDVWSATASSANLSVLSSVGRIGDYVVWERRGSGPTPGLYIDSVRVTLAVTNVEAVFVDTLEVVAVALPEVGIAVDELVRGGRLNDDQRQLLDRDGNRNGYFDLGDFLAWVDRDRIRLSPAQVAKLQSVPLTPPRPRP